MAPPRCSSSVRPPRAPLAALLLILLQALPADGIVGGAAPYRAGTAPRSRINVPSSAFAPKTELLNWLNDLVRSDYTRVEQCANGVAYCQIMDALYQGEFPIKRVAVNAKPGYESLKNYKLLQQFFVSKGIQRNVDIERLSNAKPMDNLEFLQWLKGHYDTVQPPDGAPPPPTHPQRQPSVTRSPATPPRGMGSRMSVGPASHRMSVGPASGRPTPRADGGLRGMRGYARGEGSVAPEDGGYRDWELEAKLREARGQVAALEHTVMELEKERDFYYGKLRGVELLCQATEEDAQAPPVAVAMAKEILEVMYDTPAEHTEPDMASHQGGKGDGGASKEGSPEPRV